MADDFEYPTRIEGEKKTCACDASACKAMKHLDAYLSSSGDRDRGSRLPGLRTAWRASSTDVGAEQGSKACPRQGEGQGPTGDHLRGGRVQDDHVLLRLLCGDQGSYGPTAEEGSKDRRSHPPVWLEPTLTVLHDVRPHRQASGQRRSRSSQHSLADLRTLLRS
jgi:hypothetical protein